MHPSVGGHQRAVGVPTGVSGRGATVAAAMTGQPSALIAPLYYLEPLKIGKCHRRVKKKCAPADHRRPGASSGAGAVALRHAPPVTGVRAARGWRGFGVGRGRCRVVRESRDTEEEGEGNRLVAPKRQQKGKRHTCELLQVAGTSRNVLLCAPESGK